MGLFNKKYTVNIRTKNHTLITKLTGDTARKVVVLVEDWDVTYSDPAKTSKAKRVITINEDLKIPIGSDFSVFLWKDSYLAIHID